MAAMMRPLVGYARASDGVRIAYAVAGVGPPLVRVTQVRWNHAEAWWDVPEYRRMVERFAGTHLFVTYDARGTGLSDKPAHHDFSIEAQIRDLEAVLDALGLKECALLGWQMGSPAAMAYAARRPDRVTRLVLLNPFARGEDFLNVPEMRARETYRQIGDAVWDEYRLIIAISVAGHERPALTSQLVDILGRSITPDAIRAHADQQSGVDVSSCLAEVAAQTLVVLSRQCPWLGLSHEVAGMLPHARVLFLDGVTQLWLDDEAVAGISAFLCGGAAPRGPEVPDSAPRLSGRELEVLRFISAGKSNREIAEELSLSINTVLHHVSKVFQKTGTANRAAAVSHAHRNKLF